MARKDKDRPGAGSRTGGDAGRRARFLARLSRVFDLPSGAVERLIGPPTGTSFWLNRLVPPGPDDTAAALDAAGLERAPIPWCPGAFTLVPRPDGGEKRALLATGLFQSGRLYIQNASSMVPVVALAAEPGQSVLDVCAAPGGKSALLACLLDNACELWLNDALAPRLVKLREVVATYGVRPAQITDIPGQYVDKFIDRSFDRILLDAQCSGEGLIDLARRDGLRHWSEERIETYSRLQQRMLMAAFKRLAPGGVLVYSTCTYAPEENEHPVDHLLRHVPEAEIWPIDLAVEGGRPGLTRWGERRFHPDLEGALRVTPGAVHEGFFVCRIRRRPSPVSDAGAGDPA